MGIYEYDDPIEAEGEVPEGKNGSNGMIIFTPPENPMSIGDLEFDVLMEATETLDSEVPSHPVEDRFPVHDHAINNPQKLSITGVITPLPVTWYDRFGGENPTRTTDALDTLKEIRRKRETVTIITRRGAYQDMILTSLTIPHNQENAVAIRIEMEFQHIRKVNSKTAIISEEMAAAAKNKAGQTEQNAGSAGESASSYDSNNSEGASSERMSSTLHDSFG